MNYWYFLQNLKIILEAIFIHWVTFQFDQKITIHISSVEFYKVVTLTNAVLRKTSSKFEIIIGSYGNIYIAFLVRITLIAIFLICDYYWIKLKKYTHKDIITYTYIIFIILNSIHKRMDLTIFQIKRWEK
jgi:hypothetical protein